MGICGWRCGSRRQTAGRWFADFSGAIWNGVSFVCPVFELCPNITFDLCKTVKKLANPTGLPHKSIIRLRAMGLTD